MDSTTPKRPPRWTKCHSQQIADALVRQGWTLRTEFREPPDAEQPYEYVFEWTNAGDPPPRPKASANT